MTDELGILPPARHRGRSQTCIKHADPDPCDCFAPAPKRCVCVDGQGYHRKRHSYCHESPAGLRCAFCARLRPWEKL